mmetsp:Transcript_24773/g.34140  ORF Transcript_24773/g.34140 Transcript_24773/m.34140 type:complete len:740 (-) Transcript_24773:166-2385(-)|eukprot:CAMPEP_0196593308 /NCGR_PEP_ID=MMETSP1081-20130531/75299_1 /TAXON_ID=36882 /ORGANISM="Pyramimonas amylifera, Strain CCMP720" /LENGTH=739 /DNA_ID=CAMNT_0041917259 /DNA_START=30 /DNA_END=2249 /DNA_ORIENTATION=+
MSGRRGIPEVKKRGTYKIEPFKLRVNLDPQYAEKTWNFLENAIHEIHNMNSCGLSFEELYRNAYNMVLHNHGDHLYNGLVDTITAHLLEVGARIDATQGTTFLEELNTRWLAHNKSMQMIRDILMYMDRTYVNQQNKMPVYELGLKLWREHVVRAPSIHTRMLSTLLGLVQAERKGEAVPHALIRTLTQMLMDLGSAVYQEDFEAPFLLASAAHYQAECAEYMARSSCPEYLLKAESWLQEEANRCQHYLHPSTEPHLTKVVEEELVLKQVQRLLDMPNSGLVALLQDDQFEHLARMYHLFKRPGVPGGLQAMRDVMSSHLRECGKALVLDPERCKDPVDLVQRLLDTKRKYDAIIQQAFGNDKTFHHSINQAFEHFLNLNPRSPEFISLFCDDKLRKGLKGIGEEDVEEVLDKVMMLFRYLQEKDVFEKYYKQHLAKRLLSGRSISDDIERSLIVKLKTECGYQFTSKLEGMFTDMKTSKDTMNAFKASEPELHGVDLHVQVLTTGSWPTQLGSQCNLSSQLQHCCENFKNFYLSTHTGRRLTWQTNMGTADLKATFGSAKHELNVSTYQMCVLLLFNESPTLTYTEIQSATDIPAVELKRNLQSLACVKGKNVLRKEPMSKEISEADVFHFNESFRSKLMKVKIGTVAAHKESEPEKIETRQKVEEDRKPQIEAAIVRIMKARRVLDHNNIVTEVTKQLSQRFLPNPTVIKKRIESLIERDFLERDSTDRKIYRYLA